MIDYCKNKTTSVEKLTAQAIAFSVEVRALLAERGVDSFDPDSFSNIWLDEAKKRRDEVRRGEVQPIAGLAVMEKVRKLIDDT